MSSSSSQDRRRRLADLAKGKRPLQAGGYHSSSDDTEDYYNRDDTVSSGDSEETISDLNGATASSVVAPNLYGTSATAASSSVVANLNAGTAATASSSVVENIYGTAATAASSSVVENLYGTAATAICGHTNSSSSVAEPVMACPFCQKEFVSERAVCGHMKVHRREALRWGRYGKAEKRHVEIPERWGATGRRGRGASVDVVVQQDSPNAEPDHSMDVDAVCAEPDLVNQPTPMESSAMAENSSAVSMASAQANRSGESSSKKPMQKDDVVPPRPPAAARRNPDGYGCPRVWCNMRFSTCQALGGHIAAHNNSMRAAAAGMHQGGPSKPPKQHVCKECGVEFAEGVQLGGHMRKHRPLVPKRLRMIEQLPQPAEAAPGPAVPQPADILQMYELIRSLPLNVESSSLAPAVDARQQPAPAAAAAAEGTPEPAAGPRVTGRVMLFGVDIGAAVQTQPPGQEASPATKESSSSPSTGEQK